MLYESDHDQSTCADTRLMGWQLWETIQQIAADWHDAARIQDVERAMRTEQEFRFFALFFASLPVDGEAVTTGHKAILRAIYTQLGTIDMVAVLVMLDAVIGREEAAARRGR